MARKMVRGGSNQEKGKQIMVKKKKKKQKNKKEIKKLKKMKKLRMKRRVEVIKL